MNLPPITILVVHPRENRAKCSLEPLRARADLRFVTFSPALELELEGYVRLAVDGELLGAGDAGKGILLLDGNWRRADPMNRRFAHVPGRSLRGYRTAYPRTSKYFADPSDGLASVEALYIALRLLGRPTAGLLDGYHWRDLFLAANGWRETPAAAPSQPTPALPG